MYILYDSIMQKSNQKPLQKSNQKPSELDGKIGKDTHRKFLVIALIIDFSCETSADIPWVAVRWQLVAAAAHLWRSLGAGV